MPNIPLHPALVHFPIALALLAPIVAGFMIASLLRHRELPRGWNLLVILLALAVVGGVAATRTGESEEQRVERFVGQQAMEVHEDVAESFVPAAAVALIAALSVPPLLSRKRLCAGVALICFIATIFLGALTLWIGHSGAELVYREGAAAAYVERR